MFFLIPVSAKKGSLSSPCSYCVPPPLPHVFNVDATAVQVRPRRKGIFFRRQYDTPLFTPPTLKRGGKGRNDSSDVMSMGTFFRRHRYIKKGCWVRLVCAYCLVTHAQWTRALMAACRKLMAALQHKQQCKT